MENYIGNIFGRLLVKDIVFISQKGKKRKFFKCVCSCGKQVITRADGVIGGKTKSCGCQRNDNNKGKNYSHHGYGTRIYNIWSSMKQRCENSKCQCYKYYGGKGVKIYKDWKENFESFRDWAFSNGYKENLTIDRIDVNGNYTPENCRWVSMKKQCRNRTNNHIEYFNGKGLCLSDWADVIGMNKGTLISGIRRGKTIEYYMQKQMAKC